VDGQVALFAEQLAPYAPLAAAAAAAVGADAPPAALAAASAGRVPGAYALGVTLVARRTYELPPPPPADGARRAAACSRRAHAQVVCFRSSSKLQAQWPQPAWF